jgi:predicted nucleic acid-binding protein
VALATSHHANALVTGDDDLLAVDPDQLDTRSSPLASSSIASTEGGDADDYPQSILTVGQLIARSGRSALVPL